MSNSEVLAVDLGGVIIDRVDHVTNKVRYDTSHLYWSTFPDVFEALKLLGRERFGKNIIVISKARSDLEQMSREWLSHHNFYAQTGISEDRVFYCHHRSDKALIAQRLRVTHCIDDRPEVLSYLLGIVPHRYLFRPRSNEIIRFREFLDHVQILNSWNEVLVTLLT